MSTCDHPSRSTPTSLLSEPSGDGVRSLFSHPPPIAHVQDDKTRDYLLQDFTSVRRVSGSRDNRASITKRTARASAPRLPGAREVGRISIQGARMHRGRPAIWTSMPHASVGPYALPVLSHPGGAEPGSSRRRQPRGWDERTHAARARCARLHGLAGPGCSPDRGTCMSRCSVGSTRARGAWLPRAQHSDTSLTTGTKWTATCAAQLTFWTGDFLHVCHRHQNSSSCDGLPDAPLLAFAPRLASWTLDPANYTCTELRRVQRAKTDYHFSSPPLLKERSVSHVLSLSLACRRLIMYMFHSLNILRLFQVELATCRNWIEQVETHYKYATSSLPSTPPSPRRPVRHARPSGFARSKLSRPLCPILSRPNARSGIILSTISGASE